jgi:predicted ferric reductase
MNIQNHMQILKFLLFVLHKMIAIVRKGVKIEYKNISIHKVTTITNIYLHEYYIFKRTRRSIK